MRNARKAELAFHAFAVGFDVLSPKALRPNQNRPIAPHNINCSDLISEKFIVAPHVGKISR